MSRLAKKGIKIGSGVTVEVANGLITVKGPKGTLTKPAPEGFSIKIEDGIVLPSIDAAVIGAQPALIGTYSSHINNLVEGVTTGFTKKLQIEGVGYKCELKGKQLVFALGFSHPVPVEIPEGITATVEKGAITLSGISKDAVMLFAAQLRDLKKPEPYKGKGIRYEGEVIRMKEGKKAA